MAHTDRESVLTGGHDSGPVIRAGDTVRRRLKPWSASVHALLRHLEDVQFPGAPRFLGIDDQGREVLTFVPGEDGRVARCYDDDSLAAVALMIRSFHDAVAGFVPPPGSTWRTDRSAPPGTLMCHNDLSPPNTIYAGGRPRAFIDWDLAVPSTAVWDLGYAVRTFVPLYSEEDCAHLGYQPDQRTQRLRLFCDAYGMDRQIRTELLPTAMDRLAAQRSEFTERCRDTHRRNWGEWTAAVLR